MEKEKKTEGRRLGVEGKNEINMKIQCTGINI